MLLSIVTLLLSSGFAHASAERPSEAEEVVSLAELTALHQAGDYDAVAARSGDATLTRQVVALRRAKAQREVVYQAFPEFHPRRDAADDRVRLLSAAIVRGSAALLRVDPAPAKPSPPAWAPLPDPHSLPSKDQNRADVRTAGAPSSPE